MLFVHSRKTLYVCLHGEFCRSGPGLNGNRYIPMVGDATRATELARRMRHAATFLRMASIEVRRIADRVPDIAVELRGMARQLEAEAEDVTPQLIE